MVISKWLHHFNPARVYGGHGRGAVADIKRRVGHYSKFLELEKYSALDSEIFVPFSEGEQEVERKAKIVFVPKSIKTFRTITMEPVLLQFYQQGLREQLRSHMKHLRNVIDLRSQDRNRSYARLGSIEGEIATIDLSAASDSVSWRLVQLLFGEIPLFSALELVRSSHAQLRDNIFELKKHAGMGSGVCFDIQCILYAAVCEVASQDFELVDEDNCEPISSVYTVFGDDIACRRVIAHRVIEYLQQLGFETNKDKSFVRPTCFFRESCGGEYFRGADVTPMRLSRKWYVSFQECNVLSMPEHYANIVDAANAAFDNGLMNTRSELLRPLKRLKHPRLGALRVPPRTVGDSDSFGLTITGLPSSEGKYMYLGSRTIGCSSTKYTNRKCRAYSLLERRDKCIQKGKTHSTQYKKLQKDIQNLPCISKKYSVVCTTYSDSTLYSMWMYEAAQRESGSHKIYEPVERALTAPKLVLDYLRPAVVKNPSHTVQKVNDWLYRSSRDVFPFWHFARRIHYSLIPNKNK
jgi:hypothetical protein